MAKKWLDSIDKQKISSKLKEQRDRHTDIQTDRQTKSTTKIIDIRLGVE